MYLIVLFSFPSFLSIAQPETRSDTSGYEADMDIDPADNSSESPLSSPPSSPQPPDDFQHDDSEMRDSDGEDPDQAPTVSGDSDPREDKPPPDYPDYDSSDTDAFNDGGADPPSPERLVRRNLDRISFRTNDQLLPGTEVDDDLRALLRFFPVEPMDIDTIEEVLESAEALLQEVDTEDTFFALNSAVQRLRKRVNKREANNGEWQI
ncbi:hypothetical protein BDV96DRAFT_578233 [Lophiotrema nucula]|uniref:Secreted protein n=1 Tax=Lophiotrema nucula TaxID=690887 RepID=A0A6A5Z2R0_9PLEO|nr:hypothetical protein BDV96DRAFT_578233 [Lophiotrema nucula]